ncbi:MAG: hypothetical protein ACJ72N_18270 [Labedaea sp.]
MRTLWLIAVLAVPSWRAAWHPGVIDLGTARWMLEFLCDVFDLVPSFVWKS